MKKILTMLIILLVSVFLVSCSMIGNKLNEVAESEIEKSNKKILYAHYEIAKSLLQSLQSSAAIYVAQQRKPPQKFSDFLLLEGKEEGQYTMTLEHISDQLKDVQGLDSNKLIIDFDSDLIATYTLDKTEINMELNIPTEEIESSIAPDKVKENKLKSMLPEVAGIVMIEMLVDQNSAEEAAQIAIDTLNKEGKTSLYDESKPLFGTEPADGVITIVPINATTVEITAYGKDKKVIASRKIDSESK